jgi:uncharacterized membrane protein
MTPSSRHDDDEQKSPKSGLTKRLMLWQELVGAILAAFIALAGTWCLQSWSDSDS